MLNTEVFENIKKARKHILVVTKYWDADITEKILNEIQTEYPHECIWLGENRIEIIRNKKIPREYLHFIGNIQSRKIPEIVETCSTIHSLSSIKHAQKIESCGKPVHVFIQIKLDKDKDSWISPEELQNFIEACKNMKFIEIIGISGMGAWTFWEEEKRKEFQSLKKLRDTYLPNWQISAGTSRDYTIALEQWIDIVRVWSSAIKKESL